MTLYETVVKMENVSLRLHWPDSMNIICMIEHYTSANVTRMGDSTRFVGDQYDQQ